MVGGLLGDFVKGRLSGEFPSQVERGIRLHRAVDAYSDRHPIARQSAHRFKPEFRRFGPIMVDIIYDHFLALHWQHVCAGIYDGTLHEFSNSVSGILDRDLDAIQGLPSGAQRFASRVITLRTLESYGDEQFVDRSFQHLCTRLSRKNPLHRGFTEFKDHQQALLADFTLFFPELLSFSGEWQHEH